MGGRKVVNRRSQRVATESLWAAAAVVIIGLVVGVVAARTPTAYAVGVPSSSLPSSSLAAPPASAAPAAPAAAPPSALVTGPAAGPVSPTSLEFAPQQPFTSSLPQLLTFTNTTGAPVDLEYAAHPGLSGGPLILRGCRDAPVRPGASCDISVVFHPGSGGPRTLVGDVALFAGKVTFATVPVTLHWLPVVFCQPGPCGGDTPLTAIDLGSVLDGQKGADATVQLRSFWEGDTSITGVTTTPGSGFTLTGTTCGGALPSGTTCAVIVRYAPGLHVGPATDGLTVKGPWGGSGAETLTLDAVGLAAPIPSASPTSLGFPAPQQAGVSSAPRTITVTNVGSAPMRLGAGIATGGLAGNYLITDCRDTPIAPGQACQVTVVYRPVGEAVTPRDADLVLSDAQVDQVNDVDVPITTGFVLPLGFDPTSLSFPPTPVDRVSAPQTIEVRNFFTGSGVSVIGYRISNSPDFEVTQFSCTGPMASAARCQIVVRAHPTKVGPLSGDVVISLEGAVYGNFATESVHLSGTGRS